MPMNEEDTDKAAMDSTQADAAARTQAIAPAIPKAIEPLSPAVLADVQDALVAAVDKMTGGQVTMRFAPVGDAPAEQVPPDMGKAIMGLAAMTAKLKGKAPALARYEFDAAGVMESNKGLDELTELLSGMGSDKELQKQLMSSAGGSDAGGRDDDADDGGGDDPTADEPGPAPEPGPAAGGAAEGGRGAGDERVRRLLPD